MTQCEMILRHMKEIGSISPIDALREYGCMRLAARISDLRKQGHEINSEWVTYEGRYEKDVSFKCYGLRTTTGQKAGQNMPEQPSSLGNSRFTPDIDRTKEE